ncbi:hypothetical protein NSU_1857 [Novosphingobium pentaromativorans US6-1]|uniref:Uncharacterized protein n=1 Tax=Novosphingobium pentaromativorans US6-1 TaxID=1088721 RepID=G6EBY6_9SPHN|nr:hypothetical protein NSU_1857 [Novosphingobium pentaromativorans US6-1]
MMRSGSAGRSAGLDRALRACLAPALESLLRHAELATTFDDAATLTYKSFDLKTFVFLVGNAAHSEVPLFQSM